MAVSTNEPSKVCQCVSLGDSCSHIPKLYPSGNNMDPLPEISLVLRLHGRKALWLDTAMYTVSQIQ